MRASHAAGHPGRTQRASSVSSRRPRGAVSLGSHERARGGPESRQAGKRGQTRLLKAGKRGRQQAGAPHLVRRGAQRAPLRVPRQPLPPPRLGLGATRAPEVRPQRRRLLLCGVQRRAARPAAQRAARPAAHARRAPDTGAIVTTWPTDAQKERRRPQGASGGLGVAWEGALARAASLPVTTPRPNNNARPRAVLPARSIAALLPPCPPPRCGKCSRWTGMACRTRSTGSRTGGAVPRLRSRVRTPRKQVRLAWGGARRVTGLRSAPLCVMMPMTLPLGGRTRP